MTQDRPRGHTLPPHPSESPPSPGTSPHSFTTWGLGHVVEVNEPKDPRHGQEGIVTEQRDPGPGKAGLDVLVQFPDEDRVGLRSRWFRPDCLVLGRSVGSPGAPR